ncbi:MULTISPECIES: MinD/ParA family protein [Clostridia]|uniref:MinD/ParA family protein n=1 Tax=Clostridia TaxID=186801 RepID=UPI000EA00BCA|nr:MULTISPECIES: MinD/ParA family protein [Clostridia]NBJ68385.1 MinD/ParA family protein [Roseburia sp. 1XD42-34]RKI81473.1 MinD/ParA family protein [Clostridium sp. 1xD42-85]
MKIDQATGLRNKLRALQGQKQARTIAVVSGKGGVGKSNITLNFSLELGRQGKNILIIDMDIGMGNIDILLGRQIEKTIVDMFQERCPIQSIIEQGPENLQYIAAGSSFTNIFSLDSSTKEFFLKQYQSLQAAYDYIFFDMGAGVTADSLSFILAADECFLVTTPEPTAITDGYSMIKHIIAHDKTLPISVIMNRTYSESQGRNMLNRFRKVIQQFLQVDIHLLGSLPEDQTVMKAVIRQTPFVFLHERAAISKAMKRLVRTYMKQGIGEKIQTTSTTTFLNKLKRLWTER